ncbi:MAG: ABC transporter permease [Bacteroidales bacterium]|nr:ABC transporter permease [Bacteroidales bacterium]
MKVFSLAIRNIKEVYRDPVSMLLGLAMPVALLILFSSIHKKVQLDMFYLQMLTPGIIIFCYAFLTMFSAILLAKDRQSALLTRLFTTPLKPSDFILAYILPFLPLALFQTGICLIVGALLGATFQNLILTIVIFFFTALICISIGMILGTLFTVNQVSGVGSLLITAIGLFCGAWTPLKMMGGAFETIGYALPFAHAVDAAKGLLTGSSFSDILGNFYFIIFYALALFVLAILSFRWIMRRG